MMLGMFLFTLRGSPFVYQGQELGMTNTPFESLDEYRDPATIDRVERALQTGSIEMFEEIREVVNYWSRDNTRTPMQWTEEENAGFTMGEPWIKVNPNYTEINVERERTADDSVWHYYQRLIDLRGTHPALVYGTCELVLAEHPEIYAYLRIHDEEQILIVLNFFQGTPTFTSPDRTTDTESELLISNYQVDVSSVPSETSLRPYEA